MNTLLLLAHIAGGGSLVSLLLWLLVLAIVIYIVFLILGLLPIPAQIKTIVCLILGLIFLIILLNHLGFSLSRHETRRPDSTPIVLLSADHLRHV